MIPQDQEYTSKPEIGQHGDCQRACIASLLELPISKVPHFLQEAKGNAPNFWENIQDFCMQYGYVYMTIPAGCGHSFYGLDDDDVYCVISGPSPRGNGLFHAVVGKGSKIVFDPHPSRAGLVGESKDWSYGFLVKSNSLGNNLPTVTGEFKILKDSTYEERSWPSHAEHENGQYQCTCCNCLRQFTGHKRSVICRVCFTGK